MNLSSTLWIDEDAVMNTSGLSAHNCRPTLRTMVGGVFHRISEAFQKVWSISGWVSLPLTTFSTELARLPRGTVLTLKREDAVTRLELTGGNVWITGTPAWGDIVLGPGEVYEFGDGWPYVVEALSDVEFLARGAAPKQGTLIHPAQYTQG